MPDEQTPGRTCRLVLTITQGDVETSYTVRPIASDLHVRAFQVNRRDGVVYAVTQELSGARACDCGDFVFRQHACKHIESLDALGFFLTNRELLALQRQMEVR